MILRGAYGLYCASFLFYLAFLTSRRASWGRMAFLLLSGGFILHFLFLLFRLFTLGQFPSIDLFGSLSFFAFSIVLWYFFVELKYRLYVLGLFVLPLPLLMLSASLTATAEQAPRTDPMFQSGWLPIHTALIFLSYAGLATAFGVGLAYLMQEWQIKTKRVSSLCYTLPSLDELDLLGYRLIALAYPLLTLGIVSGMVWAKQAQGAMSLQDPKILSTLLMWTFYTLTLAARVLLGWRGRRVTYMSVIGFVALIFTFLGISLIEKGWHAFIL